MIDSRYQNSQTRLKKIKMFKSFRISFLELKHKYSSTVIELSRLHTQKKDPFFAILMILIDFWQASRLIIEKLSKRLYIR